MLKSKTSTCNQCSKKAHANNSKAHANKNMPNLQHISPSEWPPSLPTSPMWGHRGGMKCYVMPVEVHVQRILFWSMSSRAFFKSSLAPWRCLTLSEWISRGHPRWPEILWMALIQESVVWLAAISRWTARVVRQVKNTAYIFSWCHPTVTIIGPI